MFTSRPSGADTRGEALRALIVDDHDDGADNLRQLLSERGWSVHVCHVGHDAVRCLREYQPHLAFISLNLPDMRGGDVAHDLCANKDGHGLVLVSLSREDQNEARARATTLGFDYHVIRPVDADEFCRAVVQIVRDENLSAYARALA